MVGRGQCILMFAESVRLLIDRPASGAWNMARMSATLPPESALQEAIVTPLTETSWP